MPHPFILLSTVIALISPIIYAKAIFKGEAKPHRTTRFVLLTITALSTLTLFAQQDTVAIWLAGVSTVQAVFIFVLSLKYGMGGYAKSDIACLVVAVVGILLWQITDNPALGLYFAILADFTGMVPTLIKTYKLPHTEIYLFFLLDVFAGFFSLMAVKQWTAAAVSFPLYIMLINLTMVFLVLRLDILKRMNFGKIRG